MEENQFRGKVETFVSDGQMCQPAASLLHILYRVDDDDVDGGADFLLFCLFHVSSADEFLLQTGVVRQSVKYSC